MASSTGANVAIQHRAFSTVSPTDVCKTNYLSCLVFTVYTQFVDTHLSYAYNIH